MSSEVVPTEEQGATHVAGTDEWEGTTSSAVHGESGS